LTFQLIYAILALCILVDQIANLPFILRHKQLLRFYFNPKLIFNTLWRPLIQNKCTKYLLILEVLLFIILQQVLFTIKIFLQRNDLLLVLIFDIFVSFSLARCYLRANQQLAIQCFVLLFQLNNSFLTYVNQSLTICGQFLNNLLVTKSTICKFLQFVLDLLYVYIFRFLLLKLRSEAFVFTL